MQSRRLEDGEKNDRVQKSVGVRDDSLLVGVLATLSLLTVSSSWLLL